MECKFFRIDWFDTGVYKPKFRMHTNGKAIVFEWCMLYIAVGRLGNIKFQIYHDRIKD